MTARRLLLPVLLVLLLVPATVVRTQGGLDKSLFVSVLNENGKPVTQERAANFQAGGQTTVDFTQPESQAAPRTTPEPIGAPAAPQNPPATPAQPPAAPPG